MSFRVAVAHTDPDHPDAGPFAYRFGHAPDFTHPITGESHSAEQVAVGLLDLARSEYPEAAGYQVSLQRLRCPGCHRNPREHAEECPETGKEASERFVVEPLDERFALRFAGAPAHAAPVSLHDNEQAAATAAVLASIEWEWVDVDEAALRERVDGKPVEVPDLDPKAKQHKLSTKQASEATAAVEKE